MKERLQTLLSSEKIASSKFADILGVNRSSISHLLSGRNNPSLDFLQRVLKRFPHISPDWLLLGQGTMYRNDNSRINTSKNIAKPDLSLFKNELELDMEEPATKKIINESPLDTNLKMETIEKKIENKENVHVNHVNDEEILPYGSEKNEKEVANEKVDNQKQLEKIIFFYRDKSFDIYFPEI